MHVETPLIPSTKLSATVGCPTYLKLENTQPGGSFKIRGIEPVLQEIARNAPKRIVMASAGSAGLACSHVARRLGIPLTVYLPEITPDFVKDKIRLEGADMFVHGAAFDHASARAQQAAREDPDCLYVDPLNNVLVSEGYSKIVDELHASLSDPPDLLVLCVGSGALLTGVCKGLDRVGWADTAILAMETVGADSYHQAIQAGRPVTLPGLTSIANCLGALTVLQSAVDVYKTRRVMPRLVTDVQSVQACFNFLDDHNMMVDPACGATLAAAYSGVIADLVSRGEIPPPRSVVMVICGGVSASLQQLMTWKNQFGLDHI